jgi:hypothetical protein
VARCNACHPSGSGWSSFSNLTTGPSWPDQIGEIEMPNRLIVTKTFRPYGPWCDEEPTSLDQITYETMRMIGSLEWLQDAIGFENSREMTHTIQHLIAYVRRLRSALPKFKSQLPDYRPMMPAFAGCVRESYHEIALDLCFQRCSWMTSTYVGSDERTRDAVKYPQPLTDFSWGGVDAILITSRFDSLRKHWPFSAVDVDELEQRVQLEAEWADKPADTSLEILTPLQRSILDALKGVALKTEALANTVCGGDTKKLHRAGGLQELRDHGLVGHKHGVGFYNTEFKPPSLIPPKKKQRAKK